MSNKPPTPEEVDQAKLLYNDISDYLECLAEIIQSEVQEFGDEDEDEDGLSPNVLKFLNEYKEFASSQPQVHAQLVNSKTSTESTNSSPSLRLRKQLWRYSQTHQSLELFSPDLLDDDPKLSEPELDFTRASPLFSVSLPNDSNVNEKLLTNETSPSVILLKAQLKKYEEYEKENFIVIRKPKYSFDIPVEEKKLIFVVKKSTAVVVAPPAITEPRQRKSIEAEEKDSMFENEKVLSENTTRKNTINSRFVSNFLSAAKVGFSGSHLSSLVWTY